MAMKKVYQRRTKQEKKKLGNAVVEKEPNTWMAMPMTPAKSPPEKLLVVYGRRRPLKNKNIPNSSSNSLGRGEEKSNVMEHKVLALGIDLNEPPSMEDEFDGSKELEFLPGSLLLKEPEPEPLLNECGNFEVLTQESTSLPKELQPETDSSSPSKEQELETGSSSPSEALTQESSSLPKQLEQETGASGESFAINVSLVDRCADNDFPTVKTPLQPQQQILTDEVPTIRTPQPQQKSKRQLKPKRKKHRPKVIDEGKSRTPKPKTPPKPKKLLKSKGKEKQKKILARETPIPDLVPVSVPITRSCRMSLQFEAEKESDGSGITIVSAHCDSDAKEGCDTNTANGDFDAKEGGFDTIGANCISDVKEGCGTNQISSNYDSLLSVQKWKRKNKRTMRRKKTMISSILWSVIPHDMNAYKSIFSMKKKRSKNYIPRPNLASLTEIPVCNQSPQTPRARTWLQLPQAQTQIQLPQTQTQSHLPETRNQTHQGQSLDFHSQNIHDVLSHNHESSRCANNLIGNHAGRFGNEVPLEDTQTHQGQRHVFHPQHFHDVLADNNERSGYELIDNYVRTFVNEVPLENTQAHQGEKHVFHYQNFHDVLADNNGRSGYELIDNYVRTFVNEVPLENTQAHQGEKHVFHYQNFHDVLADNNERNGYELIDNHVRRFVNEVPSENTQAHQGEKRVFHYQNFHNVLADYHEKSWFANKLIDSHVRRYANEVPLEDSDSDDDRESTESVSLPEVLYEDKDENASVATTREDEYRFLLQSFIQKLKIKNEINAGGAIVLFTGKEIASDAIVPYSNGTVLPHSNGTIVPLDPTKKKKKKRHELPIVDIDPSTYRRWEFLINQNKSNFLLKSNGEENEDVDWEKERTVFSGRVKSFTGRMHEIQGNRKFTLWKGSVLDSIIGVYLTQNVSDHLSSNAYMQLAAKYPIKTLAVHSPISPANYPLKTSLALPSPISPAKFPLKTTLALPWLIPRQLASHTYSLTRGETEDSNAVEVSIAPRTFEPEPSCKVLTAPGTFEAKPSSTESSTMIRPQRTKRSADSEDETYFPGMADDEKQKGKKRKKEEKKPIDWEGLRSRYSNIVPRSSDQMDSVDWEAVRCAEPEEISTTIKERGQHTILAKRIRDFLNRVVKEQKGSSDLEWLRYAPPEKVKECLLDINGLGLKSVECVRLLALQLIAFPVDVNVARIAVRLGWVPLKPLPGDLHLHTLEEYPVMDSIQKYLWPRLCTLDQRTLYELHYQLITFGKVFCTKKNPNCQACPMKAECKHYASAWASERLALPRSAEKGMVNLSSPAFYAQNPSMVDNGITIYPFEASSSSEPGINTCGPRNGMTMPPQPVISTYEPTNGMTMSPQPIMSNCEPIIEIPASPEPEDIEDFEPEEKMYEEDLWMEDDPDFIPTIDMSKRSSFWSKSSAMTEDENISKVLIALNAAANGYGPTRKLKSITRLRTEHLVFEIPDGHDLLTGLDLERRELDDPCPYLFSIWTPGETENSVEPPTRRCNVQEQGRLCNEETCFSCNRIREQKQQKVRGTILIPARTAMRGRFPLNGTYFQVNEVFADDETSRDPIVVSWRYLWGLPLHTVYFGSSTTAIFRGLQTEDIRKCFMEGFICVRGFNRRIRAPKPLSPRLHATAASRKATPKKEPQAKANVSTSPNKEAKSKAKQERQSQAFPGEGSQSRDQGRPSQAFPREGSQ